ncbi:MmpS family transport accessory protein [Mycobacterium montefiorense]|uniref:Conserved membrane protein, MmpS n=1 Tax=Mycobacterium montefiorense TaxID=154654 RepID=A0AA37UX88_9MYCO|nr:MmpS family transport accessory protein [Mycobacterium montefiorense]GBG39888.1 putative conserved membrane protein, MmpS [Mycobacterium montefiorense]GKU36563.1 putative conserved membrane protein, MmpS [Mycobacterium montefiorense]GKU38666.1 putative conserved membrane protein, MmpS [Mycobacterium montefiorense]GKU46570.1 putative conserved membrane protein, MmpS [Mycobacterium montefiorense]GKU48837.1 putative conserved membrane protein, MmpS [Mycobacterium montefiorense]
MSPRSVGRTVLARVWMPLVAVVAVAVGAVCMWKVHESSNPEPVITVNQPAAPPEFSIKRLTYELFGSVGQGGMLVWVDVSGHPHRVDLTTLPWSHTEATTLTVVSGSISAQVQGGQVGCRLRVNGVIRAEQSDINQDAHVFCLAKSA